MEKEQLINFKDKELIHSSESSNVYRLSDGRILKIASPLILQLCMMSGTSYERKVSDTRAKYIDEIVSPISTVYDADICVGFTSKKITGTSLDEYNSNCSLEELTDLHKYFELFRKIEEVVIKANKVGIIIPDLCTLSNILLTNAGQLRMLDYDGLQFGDSDKSIVLSTSLGDPVRYLSAPKYSDAPFHFNSELDKTSLTFLLFNLVFNVDLNQLRLISHSKENISLREVFQILGIKDNVFFNKVFANLSTNIPGTYLAKDLYRIACNYDMQAFKVPGVDNYVKRLTKKEL